MVFNPVYPVWDLSMLISGTFMVIFAAVTAVKIYHGSKNTFAYILVLNTALLGIAYLGFMSSEAFRREVVLPDGTKYFANVYVI